MIKKILILFFVLLLPVFVWASAVDESFSNFYDAAGNAGFDTSITSNYISQQVGAIIGQLLILLGSAAIVIIIYAGYLWMTAGDNSEQIKKAKQWLINGVIGLAIISTAYAITSFVIGAVGPQSTFIQWLV